MSLPEKWKSEGTFGPLRSLLRKLLVPRILSDVDSSYSIGVSAALGKPGRDVAVDVKVKDPRLVVRSRKGFLLVDVSGGTAAVRR